MVSKLSYAFFEDSIQEIPGRSCSASNQTERSYFSFLNLLAKRRTAGLSALLLLRKTFEGIPDESNAEGDRRSGRRRPREAPRARSDRRVFARAGPC